MGTWKKLNEYGLQEYSFEIGPMDDSDQTVAIVGLEYSSVSEDDKFYSKEDVDALIAEKDKEIARLKERPSPDIADAVASLALRQAGKPFVDPAFTRKESVKDTREAVAELKDKYCTHCAICGKPWGAGALHMQHRVTFHGRFVTNVYTCCDCTAKISCGEI